MKNVFISSCGKFVFNLDDISAIMPGRTAEDNYVQYVIRFKMVEAQSIIPLRVYTELLAVIKRLGQHQ